MFALTTPGLAAGSLRVGAVVAAQQHLWFGVWMPVAFAAYLLGVLAFAQLGPLASSTASDLAGGVLAELSGPDRLLVLAGRWALLAAGSAMAVPLFLGGGAGPLLPGWLWVLVKTAVVVAGLVVLGGRWPLLRPERVVEVGWLVVLPAVLVQLLAVAVVVVVRS